MGWALVPSSGRATGASPSSPNHRRVADRRSRCGPLLSPGNDKADITRRGSDERRKPVRPSGEIQDDEVCPLADANRRLGVRVGETTSPQRHFDDLTCPDAFGTMDCEDLFGPTDVRRELLDGIAWPVDVGAHRDPI